MSFTYWPTAINENATCYVKNQPSPFTTTIGIILWVGVFLAYVPQMIKLIQLRSNVGLSLWTTVIAAASNACSLFDAMNEYWDYFYCCRQITSWECFTLVLLPLNLICIWVCWHAIYILALVFYPLPKSKEEEEEIRVSKWTHYTVFFFYMIFMTLGFVAVVLGTTVERFKRIYWFNELLVSGFGIISAVLTLFIWVPQIYTTYTLKGGESLSLMMMIVLTPGSFVNLTFQIRSKALIWIYIPTALSGFFQCVLLVMMIYYTNAIPNLYHSIIFYFSSNPTPESIQSEQEVQSLINS